MKKFLFFYLVTCAVFANGQNFNGLGGKLSSDDSVSLVTISVYPDSIRDHVLEAARHPEILVKAESLQKSSSESFKKIMDPYSQDVQSKLWNMTRYPGLVEKLGSMESIEKNELEKIAASYPEEIRKDIVDYGKRYHETLERMNKLNKQVNEDYGKLLDIESKTTRNAFNNLVKYPDAFNELIENMHFSVLLGDAYTSDPKGTIATLDSIRNESIKQNQKEFEDWKTGLYSDPQAQKDFEKVANEFAKEQGQNTDPDEAYTDDVYNNSPSEYTPKKLKVFNTTPSNTVVVYAYPYWYGYPWWYDYPYWYPYPVWYNCGFYWGGAGVVYYGMPTPYFMHWYMFHPYHHYYYSYFSDYVINYNTHYYGPRVQHSGFNNVVNQWRRANEPNLPKGYLKEDSQRRERIKELGKFEMDYHNITKGIFGKNLTRSEFLKNNEKYYPKLTPALKEQRMNTPVTYPKQQGSVKFNTGQPVIGPKTTPSVKPQAPPVKPKIPSTVKPR